MPRLTWEWLCVVRQEVDLFRRFPHLRFATLGVLFVPALYALIYLTSVWDPASHLDRLPVGIVNLDAGLNVDGRVINVGNELVATLRQKRTFDYHRYALPEQARAAVRRGDLDFALLIPANFSAEAIPGTSAGAAKLIIYTSEGNNYTGAGFARRFAPEVAHQLNETLNEKRWEAVLHVSQDSRGQLDRLREGVHQLADGAHQLHDGSARLATGTHQLVTGMRQTRDAVHTMDARFPANADLQKLQDGAHQLSDGEDKLATGLTALRDGNRRLTDGTTKLRDQSTDLWFGGDEVASAASQLHDGNVQMGSGLDQAIVAQQQLRDGAGRVDNGTTRLVTGLKQLSSGIHTLSSRLPDDATLNRLDNGAREVAASNARLDAGLQLIVQSLPADTHQPQGSASGLAASVEPAIEVAAPVANNGIGLIPDFIPVALWIGAVMAGFLLHLRRVPATMQHFHTLSLLLGKLTLPTLIVLAQALAMLAMLRWGLSIAPPDLGSFLLTMTMTSLVCISLFIMLVKLFGVTGKALGLLLLIVQMSASGGFLPVELASPMYQALHPFMPFTWAVRTFRASLFGAYDGDWLQSWLMLTLCGLCTLGITAVVGRWRFVPDQDYGPAIDED